MKQRYFAVLDDTATLLALLVHTLKAAAEELLPGGPGGPEPPLDPCGPCGPCGPAGP